MSATASAQPVPITRVISADAIRKIGVGLPCLTSCGLNWPGVEVHRYRLAPGETNEHSYPRLGVSLCHAETPVNGEVFLAGQHLRRKLGIHTVSIAPPGLPVRARWDAPCEVSVIYLDPVTVAEIARAETDRETPEIRPQYAISDPLLRSIGIMLDAELSAERPNSRIYAESLAAAMAAQIFAKYASRDSRIARPVTLNALQLRRSIEFINDNLEKDLTLAEIAGVANMSKYHFAKSFRQMTGIPPHQYLVKVRIERARRLLTATQSASVEEIASRVGYADKSHFSAQFMKIVGVSPNRYRLGI